jgi:two-component system nitrogen regulation sensor histidine kinase NtrY
MSQPRPPLEEEYIKMREGRQRRREIVIAIVVAIVLTLLILLEYYFYDFRRATGGSNLLYFTVINVIVLLACVLLFLIFRNLTKLVFERRRRVLGSRLRTRLVVAFAAFATVPTIVLFLVSMSFITNAIERWFSLQIEGSLNESLEVAQKYYETIYNRSISQAQDIANFLSRDPRFKTWSAPSTFAAAGKAAEDLQYTIEERRQMLQVESIEVFATPDRAPLAVRSSAIPKNLWPKPERDFLQKGFNKQAAHDVDRIGDAELARGLAPVITPQGEVAAVVLVGYYVPEGLLEKMKHIQQTYKEYHGLRLYETPIRSSYFIFLGLISLFILFSATWMGFYLARQITDPLQTISEGARKVAAGEMNLRLQKVADDEIGTLVEAFNKMLDDLATSHKALEGAYADLEATNVELERRRASMEAILNNVAAGVLSFDNEGRVLTVNPSAERILGVKAEQATTKTWTDVFPAEFAEAFKKLGEALFKGKKWTVQSQIEVTIGGALHTLLAILSVHKTAPGGVAGAVLVVEDLTELLKAQRVGAWQEIARRIAHEIKNPLTPIQLAAQRLRKRYGQRFDSEQDTVFSDSTGVIIRQVEEMKRMVQEFSDFARLAEARPAPTDLAAILNEVVILYREAHRRIDFDVEIPPALPAILADHDQLKRALINVIDNAVEAIEGPGRVTARIRHEDEKKQVVIEIGDTGAGIPKAYRSRLFEPYFSTKKMGTGLGLAIVHRIVTDHGGAIQLRDNQPHGTVVTITLPIRPVEKAAEENSETAKA